MRDEQMRDRGRQLRQEMTEVEKLVWSQLRNRRFQGLKFVRQEPLGQFVADFLCREHQLIVELDGGGHNTPEKRQADAERTKWLEEQGYRVLRFWNHDVLRDWECVAEVIVRAIQADSTATSPSPGRLKRPPSPRQRGEG